MKKNWTEQRTHLFVKWVKQTRAGQIWDNYVKG